MKTIKVIGSPEFIPLTKGFKTICCDCRLTHEWVFTKRKGVMGFLVTRDNRATAQFRRHKPARRWTVRPWGTAFGRQLYCVTQDGTDKAMTFSHTFARKIARLLNEHHCS